MPKTKRLPGIPTEVLEIWGMLLDTIRAMPLLGVLIAYVTIERLHQAHWISSEAALALKALVAVQALGGGSLAPVAGGAAAGFVASKGGALAAQVGAGVVAGKIALGGLGSSLVAGGPATTATIGGVTSAIPALAGLGALGTLGVLAPALGSIALVASPTGQRLGAIKLEKEAIALMERGEVIDLSTVQALRE